MGLVEIIEEVIRTASFVSLAVLEIEAAKLDANGHEFRREAGEGLTRRTELEDKPARERALACAWSAEHEKPGLPLGDDHLIDWLWRTGGDVLAPPLVFASGEQTVAERFLFVGVNAAIAR